MAVSAPPRPPGSTASIEHDRFDALIEEARQRARGRRRTYGAITVVVVIAAIAANAAINGAATAHGKRSGLGTPVIAPAPDPPNGLIAFADNPDGPSRSASTSSRRTAPGCDR